MKVLWWILNIIPIPFLHCYYLYELHLNRGNDELFRDAYFFFVLFVGILSMKVKLPWIFGIAILSTLISFILAALFVPNDADWFKPFDRNIGVVIDAAIFYIGQLMVRTFIKAIIGLTKFIRRLADV